MVLEGWSEFVVGHLIGERDQWNSESAQVDGRVSSVVLSCSVESVWSLVWSCTTWILNMYKDANACEALAVVGFAIEETVSILYKFIWDGLKKTDMNPQDYVFFPLHILVDDHHADLLIAGFANYMKTNPEACARAPELVMATLDRRTQMLDELRELVAAAGLDTCSIPAHANPIARI